MKLPTVVKIVMALLSGYLGFPLLKSIVDGAMNRHDLAIWGSGALTIVTLAVCFVWTAPKKKQTRVTAEAVDHVQRRHRSAEADAAVDRELAKLKGTA